MENKRGKANRTYKDRLFKLIFKEKKDLMQLYNAINNTYYDNPDEIEVNTIEDAVYMGMKNDVSFLIKDVLNLYEHQSTYSPNLPLRGLFYFADLYRKLAEGDRDIYSSRQIQLPFPQFVVFYNGRKEEPEQQILYLHEAFSKKNEWGKAALDCRAIMLNINLGHNKVIMQKCRKLEEYAIFIGKIREYTNQQFSMEAAIDKAVDECIENGVLEDILRKNREEVCSMLLTEYNEQYHIESEREIAKEEGIKEGIRKGIEEGQEQEQRRLRALIAKMTEAGETDKLIYLAEPDFLQNMFQKYHL